MRLFTLSYALVAPVISYGYVIWGSHSEANGKEAAQLHFCPAQ